MSARKHYDLRREFVIRLLAQRAAAKSYLLQRHVAPIYRVDSNNEPEHFGTCVFLTYGEKKFLVTAAHVLDAKKDTSLYIPCGEHGILAKIEGSFFQSVPLDGNRQNYNIDIGIVTLDSGISCQISNNSFIPFSAIDTNIAETQSNIYIAMGYPWRKNGNLNRTTRKIRPWLASYAANSLPLPSLPAKEIHANSHLFIRYKKEHSKNTEGQELTAPDPHGMSGGALWRYDSSSSHNQTPRLVGILTEWHKNHRGLLAVRMTSILRAMEQIIST